MNALEIADYLKGFVCDEDDYDESKHNIAAIMLRQQQAEIEVLKEQLNLSQKEK